MPKLNDTMFKFNEKDFIDIKTVETAYDSVKVLDMILSNISYSRAVISAWYKRLGFSKEVIQLLISNDNSKINTVMRKIEYSILKLSLQSSTGIYNNEDRRQLDYEYKLLFDEINRISSKYEVESRLIGRIEDNDNLLTVESADKIVKRIGYSVMNNN